MVKRDRFPLLVALMLVAALAIAGCGSGQAAPDRPPANTDGTGANTDGAGSADAETAPAAAEPLTITHALGETTVPVNPQRVVVFDLGALDTLDKLGVDIIGLPQSSTLPAYLAKYSSDDYANVGSLVEPDFEAIYALRPDLIIISGRQQDHYEELSRIAPTIFVGLDLQRYHESFAENVMTLGRIFGKEDVVAAELEQLNADIAALQAKVAADGGDALVVLTNEGSVSAFGHRSRFGVIHDVFGFPASDSSIEVTTHGQSVSLEYIVSQDPDYLFVVDRSAALQSAGGASGSIENELTASMKAVQNGNVVYLRPDIWYLSGGGLTSYAEMVRDIDAALD